jgi:hypothetical protein
MVKLLVLAVLLASSPASGLLETLFRTENSCYSGCHANYAASGPHLDACKNGCNYKLYNEDCASKCRLFSRDEQIQASCQVGCTLSRPVEQPKPVIPVVAPQEQPAVVEGQDSERPHSIILVRLRQRPFIQMPGLDRLFSNDPVQMFNDMLRQFREKANELDQSFREPFERPQELPKPGDFGPVFHLIKSIPIGPLLSNVRPDSSSESSEEKPGQHEKLPLVDEIKHAIKFPREHQQRLRERVQPLHARVQQFFADVRNEWNDLVRRQPKIPIWIFLCILLTSSAILWYMVMSLCRHTPSREALSIRSQELVFHPYEHDAYEKEKIQPDEQLYQVTESLPIKVKLSNI